MLKKLLVIAAIVLAGGAFTAVSAWNAGFCQKAGCHCHQYYGGPGAQDRCTVCGHVKAAHA